MRRTDRRLGPERDGTALLVGLLIGVAIFAVSFYVVVETAVKRDADVTQAENANLAAQAASLTEVLVEQGAGWYTSTACTTVGGVSVPNTAAFDPDRVGAGGGRFGLGDDACGRSAADPATRNNLSFAKLSALPGGLFTVDGTNDRVDYPEARNSLGLAGRQMDFHIRTWPVLASTRQILNSGQLDPYARPVYIGDYYSVGTPPKQVQHTTCVIDGADQITVCVDITNNGTSATIFATFFSIPLEKHSVDFTLHTPLLAPGAHYNMSFAIRKTNDWSWDNPSNQKISYTIQDKDGGFQSSTINLAGITMTYSSSRLNVFPEADQMYWVLGGPLVNAKLNYAAYKGDGDDQAFADWTISTLTPLGLPLAPIPLPNEDGGFATQPLTLVGANVARIRNDLLTSTWNSDILNIVTTAPGPFTTGGVTTYAPASAVIAESRYVDLVIEHFDRAVYPSDYTHVLLPYAAGGDVYPDLKEVLNEDLKTALTDATGAPSLSKYNLLIVGSDVDHNAMTSAAAKYAIRDWVLEGGTLISFGSAQQNVNWLQPLFHASLETAGGGLYTPDADHPALRVPNQLDYVSYEYSTTWGYNAGADASFTHVVQSGSDDVLGIGNPGAFGEGRVLLTSWEPHALTADQATACAEPIGPDSNCQPLFLIHNLLTLSYRGLYIDFGPPVPTGSPVGSQLRVASVYHPELRELVAIGIEVLTFPGGS